MFQSERQRAMRRSAPIRGYVGANGSGKTFAAVWDLLPSLDAGRPVLSTARLLDFRRPRSCDDDGCEWPGHPDHGAAHPAWVPMTDWRQLLEFRDGDVLLDEVAGVASSRQSGALPFQVERDLQRLRHRRVTLSYTAPAWARTEKIIRETSILLTHCRGRMGERRHDTETVTSWRRNRLLSWRTYDATELDKLTNSDVAGEHDQRSLRAKFSQLFWVPGSLATLAYDSLVNETISVGWANEAGICMECGGRRRIPECHCGKPARGRGAAEAGSPARAQREDDPATTAPAHFGRHGA